MEFYDENGTKIEGTIIGTEGEGWAPKEKAFDGNILTGFSALSPDGNWVGLKLQKPKRIARLRFIPRNDGNCIEIDDEYELRYWKQTNGSPSALKRPGQTHLSTRRFQVEAYTYSVI